MRYATQPAPSPEGAKERHRDGFSCKTTAAYSYDANGHKRWCIDCGTELGEQAWSPEGKDVPVWLAGVFWVLAGVVMLALLWLFVSIVLPESGPYVPGHTPVPMPGPTVMVP